MNKITMLGTGNATVTQIYNTCFVLATDTTRLLVDAGGGNGILSQLKKVDFPISEVHHLFVTHAHTDHVLGVIWVIRMVAQCKGYEGQLHVYGHDKVMRVIRTIIDMILAKKQLQKVEERVVFHLLEDGDAFEVGDMKLTCFDIHSTKEKQFGFRAELPVEGMGSDGSREVESKPMVLACLGDEPYNPDCEPYVKDSDWLLHEAFCLYEERDRLIKQEGRLDDIVEKVLRSVFSSVAHKKEYKEPVAFYRYMLDNVSYQVDPEKAHQTFRSKKTKENFLWEIAKSELEAKYEILGTDEVIAQFQRMAILKAIDENWVEQVDYLQQLRMALSGQYTSQKNPLVEFFQEAYQSFERMKEAAKEQMVRNLLLSRVEINKKGEIVLHFP